MVALDLGGWRRGSSGASPRVRRRTRSAVAFALVLLLHLAALLLLSRTTGTSLARWGSRGAGPGMAVNLVGASMVSIRASLQPNLTPPAPVPVPTYTPLTDPEPVTPRMAPSDKASSHTEAAQPQQAAPAEAGRLGDAGANGAAADSPADFDRDPYAHASLMMKPDPTALDAARLRLQVARCWKAVPSAPPVTLAVTLDDRGGVVGAPTPVRAIDAKVGPELLQAETAATQALQACAPYALPTEGAAPSGPRTRELTFEPAPSLIPQVAAPAFAGSASSR